MKKFNKKKTTPADIAPEKGAATQEMEAIMDAASEDTADIDLLLDENAPKEDLPTEVTDTDDGIDDIPDALDPVLTEDTAAPADVPADVPPVKEEAPADVRPVNDAEEEDDDLQPTEPAPDEEVSVSSAADDTAAEADASYKNLGLYLHIPFCKSKCAYCDFYSSDKIVCQGPLNSLLHYYKHTAINLSRIFRQG